MDRPRPTSFDPSRKKQKRLFECQPKFGQEACLACQFSVVILIFQNRTETIESYNRAVLTVIEELGQLPKVTQFPRSLSVSAGFGGAGFLPAVLADIEQQNPPARRRRHQVSDPSMR
jgi:hypothetical protein